MLHRLAQLHKLGYMFRALSYRNYRLFFLGQAVSLIGLWMTRIATQWLVYRLTESPWMLGVVGFAQLAPSFFMSPIGGAIVDRGNRLRVLIGTQWASMGVSLALAALAFAGVIEVWHVLVLVALEGVVRGVDMPARQALVVDLVDDRADLANAIALNSTAFNSARLIGPAVGGVIVATMGEAMCFLIDGLSYIAVVAALMAMRLAVPEPRAEPKSILADLREGVTYTFGFAPHRALLMLSAVVVLAGSPHMALLPVFARDILGGDSNILGLLMAASGAGALLGAMYLATRRSVRGLGRVLAGCTIAFGVLLVIFAFSQWIVLTTVVLAVAGFAMMTLMAGSNTVMQTLVDDAMRGRVMAFFLMAFMGAAPLGHLLGGAVAERIGAEWTVAIGGLACVVMGAIFARQLPALRELVRPVYVERGIIPEVAEGVRDSGGSGTVRY